MPAQGTGRLASPLLPKGNYILLFDPLDGSSNVSHGLPVGFLFGISKRNTDGVEDYHLRAGREYIAAGMFVIPTGMFTIAFKDAGTWRFHMDETMKAIEKAGAKDLLTFPLDWGKLIGPGNVRENVPPVHMVNTMDILGFHLELSERPTNGEIKFLYTDYE